MNSANVRFLLVPRVATGLLALEVTVGASYHYSVTEACVFGMEEDSGVAGPKLNLGFDSDCYKDGCYAAG